ncbi:MAG: tRNA 4-thiouridine(8) synthase ThiI [Candidatus Moranbacteria bacterium]|nr:tRNA 4-thiouridine(8) synthase ThiI [Candidatus Moranbacteria bacterium]
MQKLKAILLFSGGLDSIIAYKLLQKSKIEILPVTFVSSFFKAKQAKESIKSINQSQNLKIINIEEEFLKIVKKPKYGYGKNLNPCIDCHSFMLEKAKRLMLEKDFDLIATGEVLGQRPFSQNKEALKRIEKHTKLEGKILRPLSAKILPKTQAEKEKLLNPKYLEAISGRSRKKQLALAEKFQIKSIPSPGGGCLLTDPLYSSKAEKIISKNPDARPNDFELIKSGRLFIKKTGFILIGRNHQENLKIKDLSQKSDRLFEPKNVPGPTGLVRFFKKKDQNLVELCKIKIIKHTNKIDKKTKLELESIKIY